MRRRARASGLARKKRPRKPAKLRRASKPVQRPASSAAALQKQVGQLARELAEAREQQAATSEVLKVISSSSGELEPVFRSMLRNAVRICEAKFGVLSLREEDAFRVVAAMECRRLSQNNGAENQSSGRRRGHNLGRLLRTKESFTFRTYRPTRKWRPRSPSLAAPKRL